MSGKLEQAQRYFSAGENGKAIDALWEVVLTDDSTPGDAQALLDLATALRDRTDGSLRGDCEHQIRRAQQALAALSPHVDPQPLAGRACPRCSGEMAPGFFTVEGAVGRFTMINEWRQSLCFRAYDASGVAQSRERISEGPRRGWFCRGCQTSLIMGPDPEGRVG